MTVENDTATWLAVREATEQYDQYLKLQRLTDVVGALQDERDAEPQPHRTDLPLSLGPID